MSTRSIITAICIGFLVGMYWIGDPGEDGWLGIYPEILQIKLGLTCAAIFGLLAAAYDALPPKIVSNNREPDSS